MANKLDELKKSSDLLSPKFWLTTEVGWRMKFEETKVVAEFLIAQHQPISPIISVKDVKESSMRKNALAQMEVTFVPKVGALCPECGQHKLIRKSINRSDGTETDFLACQGYPNTCKAIFPLVAVVRQTMPSYETLITPVTTSNREGMLCPKCGTGKLVRRKGKNGKPDFLGCSNYGKIKCGFMGSIS